MAKKNKQTGDYTYNELPVDTSALQKQVMNIEKSFVTKYTAGGTGTKKSTHARAGKKLYKYTKGANQARSRVISGLRNVRKAMADFGDRAKELQKVKIQED